jgi:hypothetical protein
MNVADVAGLARLRYAVGRFAHDDERLRDAVVTLLRSGATVGCITCATDALAWDAYRLVAGIRYRQENGAAWQTAEAEAA